MAYLVPFSLALQPAEKVNFRGLILTAEPDIPDDSYQFQEWYCPDLDCDCFQGVLEVLAIQQKYFAARLHVPFAPGMAPFLDPRDPITPTALALLKIITQHLQDYPEYLTRLRDHYWLVRRAATDPNHPAHLALLEWVARGAAAPASKPNRKRH